MAENNEPSLAAEGSEAVGTAGGARPIASRAAWQEAAQRVQGTPREVLALLALARWDAAEGNVDGALLRLNGALQRHPSHAPIFLTVAYILRDNPERDGADSSSDLLQTPESLPRMFVPAMEASRTAGGWMNSLLPQRSARRAIHRAHYLALRKLDWQGAADEILGALARIEPNRLLYWGPILLGRLADCLDLAEKRAQAAEIAFYATRRYPSAAAIRPLAARLACQMERWDEAERILAPALQANESNRVARGCEALAKLGRGEPSEAWKILERWGISHSPDYLAELTLRLAAHDPRFSKAAPSTPVPVDASAPALVKELRAPKEADARRLILKAEKLLVNQEFEAGLELLDSRETQPLDGLPAQHQAYWLALRGYALFEMRRASESLPHFSAAAAGILASEASNLEASLGGGLLGRLFEALRNLTTRSPVYVSDEWVLMSFREAMAFGGDPASSVETFLEIAPTNITDSSAHFYMGLAYWRLGRIDEARRALRTAYRRYFDDSNIAGEQMIHAISREMKRLEEEQAQQAAEMAVSP
jgi:tetratricopeptide (TPR) repeat protein